VKWYKLIPINSPKNKLNSYSPLDKPLSQITPVPAAPKSPTFPADLVVKGRVNISARDIIATTPLEYLGDSLEELATQPPEESLEELPEESPEELAAKAAEIHDRSIAEYRRLQFQLLLVTLGIALLIFFAVWAAYSLPTALNYLLGGCTGVVYLKMLARDVERLGNQSDRLGYARLAPFIGLMIIATRWHDLQIVPIFLGFLTYKAAILVYALKTSL
jgi:ATP synthase protein I